MRPPSEQVQPLAEQVQPPREQVVQLGGLAALGGLGGLGEMIQKAIQQGNVEVTEGPSQVIDLRGSGLRERILDVMQQHGIDPEPGGGEQIDASSVPGLQDEILKALSEHGVDVGGSTIDVEWSGEDARPPGTPGDPSGSG